MSFNLFSKETMMPLITLAMFIGVCFSSMASEKDLETPSSSTGTFTLSIKKSEIRTQPQFIFMDSPQVFTLLTQAKAGDRQAQDQLIERNYWGFIERPYQCSLWGQAGKNSNRLNPLLWEDIENRAIENDQYAYALIDAYAHYLRWTHEAKIPFPVKFPHLFRSIQEKAEAGEPCAQFNVGVMYLQLSPQHTGLQANSNTVTLAFEIIKKAADQGHPLAMTSLGQIAWTHTPKGRDVEALRWFVPSKNNKISQDALLKDLLVFQSKAPREEGTFHAYIESIKFKLGFLLGEHSMQIGLHNPNGGLLESHFSIPKLPELYRQVIEVEEEAIGFLTSLQHSTPGIMITGVVLKEVRDRDAMISRQKQPVYVSVNKVEKTEYLTLGEKNVPIATQFLAYVNVIEEKFAKADKILQEDSESYQIRLQKHFSKLKETRLLCLEYQKLCNEKPSEIHIIKYAEKTKKFNNQKEKYEEIEPILTKAFQKLEGERKIFAEVKENIKNLIPSSVGRRNHDFFLEHSYLK